MPDLEKGTLAVVLDVLDDQAAQFGQPSLTRALPRDAPVHLVEVARLWSDCDMDFQFELGLDLILSGLEARL